jgi:hypothetical protein
MYGCAVVDVDTGTIYDPSDIIATIDPGNITFSETDGR